MSDVKSEGELIERLAKKAAEHKVVHAEEDSIYVTYNGEMLNLPIRRKHRTHRADDINALASLAEHFECDTIWIEPQRVTAVGGYENIVLPLVEANGWSMFCKALSKELPAADLLRLLRTLENGAPESLIPEIRNIRWTQSEDTSTSLSPARESLGKRVESQAVGAFWDRDISFAFVVRRWNGLEITCEIAIRLLPKTATQSFVIEPMDPDGVRAAEMRAIASLEEEIRLADHDEVPIFRGSPVLPIYLDAPPLGAPTVFETR